MKTYITVGVIAAFILGAATARVLIGNSIEVVDVPVTPAPLLSHQQTAWLGALEWCESGGKPSAINPKDRDNTPSYGILQFKPSTFTLFAKEDGLASTTDYMNPDAQEAIVTQMILRRNVNWSQQFPVCTGILGTPPLSTNR